MKLITRLSTTLLIPTRLLSGLAAVLSLTTGNANWQYVSSESGTASSPAQNASGEWSFSSLSTLANSSTGVSVAGYVEAEAVSGGQTWLGTINDNNYATAYGQAWAKWNWTGAHGGALAVTAYVSLAVAGHVEIDGSGNHEQPNTSTACYSDCYAGSSAGMYRNGSLTSFLIMEASAIGYQETAEGIVFADVFGDGPLFYTDDDSGTSATPWESGSYWAYGDFDVSWSPTYTFAAGTSSIYVTAGLYVDSYASAAGTATTGATEPVQTHASALGWAEGSATVTVF